MFSGVQGNVSPGAIWKRKPLKHGFHMIAAITLKKKFSDIAIIWKPLSSNHSNSLTMIAEIEKSSISAIVVSAIATIAGKRFPYDRYDRSDHIETRL